MATRRRSPLVVESGSITLGEVIPLTPEEIQESGYGLPPLETEAESSEGPGLLRSVGDSGVALARGVVSGVRGITDIAGTDNTVSQALGRGIEFLDTLESPERRAERQRRAQLIKQAEETGEIGREVAAYLGSFVEAPLDTILEALGTSAPTLAAALASGPVGVGARLAMSGTIGGVQGAGFAKRQIAESVEQGLIEAGVAPEEAKARAIEAQSLGGPNTGQIIGAGALGVVAGRTGAEGAVARSLAKTPIAGSRAAQVLAATGGEFLTEAAQGGHEQFAGNIAQQREGLDVPLMQGVLGSAALEGVAGAGVGGGVSLLAGGQHPGEEAPGPSGRSIGEMLADAETPPAPGSADEPVTVRPAEDRDRPLPVRTRPEEFTEEQLARARADADQQLERTGEDHVVEIERGSLAVRKASQSKGSPVYSTAATEDPAETQARNARLLDQIRELAKDPLVLMPDGETDTGWRFGAMGKSRRGKRAASLLRRAQESGIPQADIAAAIAEGNAATKPASPRFDDPNAPREADPNALERAKVRAQALAEERGGRWVVAAIGDPEEGRYEAIPATRLKGRQVLFEVDGGQRDRGPAPTPSGRMEPGSNRARTAIDDRRRWESAEEADEFLRSQRKAGQSTFGAKVVQHPEGGFVTAFPDEPEFNDPAWQVQATPTPAPAPTPDTSPGPAEDGAASETPARGRKAQGQTPAAGPATSSIPAAGTPEPGSDAGNGFRHGPSQGMPTDGLEYQPAATPEADTPAELLSRLAEHRANMRPPSGSTPEQFREFIDRRRQIAADLANRMKPVVDADGLMVPTARGRSVMVTPDTDNPRQYRITRLDADGTPSGHEVYNDIPSVVDGLMGMIEPAPAPADAPSPAPAEAPMEPAEPERSAVDRSAQAQRRMAAARRVDPSRDTLIVAVARLGGIDRAQAASEWGLRPEELRHPSGVFGLPLFRKTGGRSIDDMRLALQEYGYLTDPDDHNELEDKITDGLSGIDHYAPEGAEAQAQAEHERRLEAEQDMAEQAELDDEALAEREAIQAESEAIAALDELDDDQLAAINRQLSEVGDETAQLDDAALDALAETAEAIARAESAQEAASGEESGPGTRGSEEQGDREGLTLTGQTEAEARAPAAPGAPITDFGEKIAGARKELWQDFRERMAKASKLDVAAEPLSKSWPAPDYQALLDAGADPWVTGLIRSVRDAIPAKPKKPWKLREWVGLVTSLRGIATDLLDGTLDRDAVMRRLDELAKKSRLIGEIADRAELYQLVGHSKSLAGVRVTRGEYTLYKGESFSPPKVIWVVEKRAAATAFSNWPRELASGETREAALADFKARFDSIDVAPPARQEATFEIYSKRGEEGYWIGKKVGRQPLLLEGPFPTLKEARAYKDEHNADLVAKLERARDIPSERRDTNQPRVGEDHRGGRDATPQLFAETFGFRGVQFGNYVEQSRRQQDLNDAFDALMDMAATLGLPPRALSLNGELGLAFGARGRGGKDAAAAHYEREHVVINLTKRKGAGSLGHEWWHALDNYFSRLRGKGDDYMTEATDVSAASSTDAFIHRGEVRREMVAAFGAVVRAIRSTALQARANKLDGRRSKAYWTTGREMSARAFESYLISKLQDAGASNDHLANIVDETTWAAAEAMGFELEGSYPYPTAGEVPAIRAAFDHFFQTIDTRETDRGLAVFEPSAEYHGVYEQVVNQAQAQGFQGELFGPGGAPTDAARSAGAGVPGDVQPAGAVSRAPAAVALRRTADLRVGLDRVESAEDAAHFFAELRKSPSERFNMLVLDAERRPLSYLRLFQGSISSTAVPPREVILSAYADPRARYVWIAHNHPSGTPDPSHADRRLTAALARSFGEDLGVELAGHVIIAGQQARELNRLGDVTGGPILIRPAARTKTVSVVERVMVRQPSMRGNAGSPDKAREAVRKLFPGNATGLMLLDVRNNVIGVVPMSDAEMGKLRVGGRYADLMRMLGEHNAAGLIVVSNGGASHPFQPGQNIGSAIEGLDDVRALDILVRKPNGEFKSAAEAGEYLSGGTFFSRGTAGRGMPVGTVRATAASVLESPGPNQGTLAKAHAARVQEVVAGIAGDWAIADRIDVLTTFDEAPERVRRENEAQLAGGAAGVPRAYAWEGRIALVADQLHTASDIASALYHESTHFGLRGAFGPALDPILDEIARRRAGEVKGIARKYGLDFNNERQRRIAAEEMLAAMAESNPKAGFVTRAIAAIRNVLDAVARRFGFDLELTDAQLIRNFLLPAREYARHGGRARGVRIFGRTITPFRIHPSMSRPGPIFFSALTHEIGKINARAQPVAGWKQRIAALVKKGAVKADELEWTGINEWLDLQSGRVTKEAVLDFLDDNAVRVEETQRGGGSLVERLNAVLAGTGLTAMDSDLDPESPIAILDEDENFVEFEDLPPAARAVINENPPAPRYGQYTLPGGRDYRELLLTRPGRPRTWQEARDDVVRKWPGADADTYEGLSAAKRETFDAIYGTQASFERRAVRDRTPANAFRSAHWDTPNVLAHVRFNERTDPNGRRVLFIEEIQSDWAQAGRKEGFQGEPIPQSMEWATVDTLDWFDSREAAEATLPRLEAAWRRGESRSAIALQEFRSVAPGWQIDRWSRPFETGAAILTDPQGTRYLSLAARGQWFPVDENEEFLRGGDPASDEIGRAASKVEHEFAVEHENGQAGGLSDEARRRLGIAPNVEARLIVHENGPGDFAIVEQHRNTVPSIPRPDGVPSAPFVGKTDAWVGLALKRMIRYAAENGFDRVAFIDGDRSADRYDLSKQVESISAYKVQDGYKISAKTIDGDTLPARSAKNENELSDLVGKELASKIVRDLNAEGMGDRAMNVYSGLDLKVGGEGMRTFYDKIVPKVARDVLKKLGGNLSTVDVDLEGEAAAQVGFDITPEMRSQVMEGLPLFSRAQEGTEAFRRWFGDSKIVDGAGRPERMYHGTAGNFAAFDMRRGGQVWGTSDSEGVMWFSGSTGRANAAARDAAQLSTDDEESYRANTGANVMPVYLRVENPHVLTRSEILGDVAAAIRRARERGHDGVIMAPGEMGDRDVAVFSPDQVKSALGNTGTFDPADPDIRFSRSPAQQLMQPGGPTPDAVDALGRGFTGMLMQNWKDSTRNSRSFKWWRGINTQYHKATLDSDFKRVFDAAQDFQKDVSRYANRAADLAPTLLPNIASAKDILRKARVKPEDMEKVAEAILAGTLEDADPAKGKVWTDTELRLTFGMNERQIGLYKEFRNATDQGLDDFGRSEIIRFADEHLDPLTRRAIMEAPGVRAAFHIVRRRLAEVSRGADKETRDAINNLRDRIEARVDRVEGLIAGGYAPLMRFGRHAVLITTRDEKGGLETQWFSLHDNVRDANRTAREMLEEIRREHPKAELRQGVASDEEHKLFAGVTPDTLQVFGDEAGFSDDPRWKKLIELTKSQRSALKRMLERKRTPGFSRDMTRVLAAFVTSQGRATAGNVHAGELVQAVRAIPQEKGDVKDDAVRLYQYLQNPTEEAQAIRGLLFTWFLGGSVASAAVNITQPLTMSLPYLAVKDGAAKASARILAAARDVIRGKYKPDTAKALKRAELEGGVVDPQEVHMLQAEVSRNLGASVRLRKAMFAWGYLFAAAERFNRRVTFVAAYEQAKELGSLDPVGDAELAVVDTQGIYNRGNRPNWARGAIPATVMTFKQFSIAYVEFVARLLKNKESRPAGLLALGILIMLSGLSGLPFMEDLDDIIDTVAQAAGYNFQSDAAKQEFIAGLFGEQAADFALYGLSSIPGSPVDVQARLGLGNLIPGTAAFKKSGGPFAAGRETLEVFGAVGGLGKQAGQATTAALEGDPVRAVKSFLPVAATNFAKGLDMLQTGMYRDTRGRKVIETGPADAFAKSLGFQPASVGRANRLERDVLGSNAIVRATEAQIAGQWATGVFEKDEAKIARARERLRDWNRNNPATPIRISPSQIRGRVRQMSLTRGERIVKSSPREVRAAAARALRQQE